MPIRTLEQRERLGGALPSCRGPTRQPQGIDNQPQLQWGLEIVQNSPPGLWTWAPTSKGIYEHRVLWSASKAVWPAVGTCSSTKDCMSNGQDAVSSLCPAKGTASFYEWMSIYNHGVTELGTAGNWMLDVAMVLYGVWKMRFRRLGGAHCSGPISRPTRTRITGLLQEMLVPGAMLSAKSGHS